MKAAATPVRFNWPTRELPTIVQSSRNPLDDRGYSHDYRTPHTHALHVYDYACGFRLGGRNYSIRAGDVTLTPMGVSASYDLPRPGYHWCVHFHPAKKANTRMRTASLPIHLSLRDGLSFALERMKLISRLHAQAHRDPVACDAASVTLLELLLWLGVHQPETAKRGPNRTHSDRAIIEVADLIEQKLDKPLSVPDLAKQVGLSQNYLARQFRQRFGATINQYLLRRRMELAKQLLRSTAMPVGLIAARVGLPDPHYFNKQFRNHTGQSPTDWRSSTV